MFSSRNIHFAILGIILGATTGYVFAFYSAQKAHSAGPPALSESQAQGTVPTGHPSVNDDQFLASMQKAVENDPTNSETVSRFAMALFEAGRINDAEKWFAKSVELAPKDPDARSMYGLALWQLGKIDAAEAQLEATLKIDPSSIPGLHGLVRLNLQKGDVAKAEQFINRIEAVEPGYSQLSDLKRRLEATRSAK
jgi:tetratricopeptide (TPR) repeat protein